MDHDPYGLSDRPFQLTPDPRFYFESSTHRKAMTYLGYGLAQGEGFIVVTGEVGTGKTMLVGRLMATIDRARLTAINLVSTQLEGEDILRIVALALGVATEAAAKGQLLARIERFLHEQARSGKRTLLIVDEAQNLPISALEELRMLSNFQFGGQALLQIFLLGQPEFRDALAQPRFEQLRQRVIATHHLTAMNPDEAAPYIMHRLACAGWKGTPRFTQDAYDAFHRLSGGIPRRLNMLAGRVMLQGAIERLTDIDGEVVEDVAADLASESIMPADGPQPTPRAMPLPYPEQPVSQFIAPPPLAFPAAPPPAPRPVEQAPAPIAPPLDVTPSAPPPAEIPEPFAAPTAYDSYAPVAVEEPARPVVPVANPFAGLPGHVPPPAIEQPPRYDGYVPPEAVPAPSFPVGRPQLRAVEATPETDDEPETEGAPASVSPVPETVYQAVEPASQVAPPAAVVPPEPNYQSYAPPEPEPAVYQTPAPPIEPASPIATAPALPPAGEIDYAARNAELEARLAEQEAILRRTLSLLVELVENDPRTPQDPQGSGNQDAA